MNREERRRAERDARRTSGSLPPSWAPQRLQTARMVPSEREDAERQDFLAGTLYAFGAAAVFPLRRSPGDPDPQTDPMFVVVLQNDERTFGPWPAFAAILDRVQRLGAGAAADSMTVSTAWSAALGEEPMVKLKLDVVDPAEVRSSAQIVLMAENYARIWHVIAAGGIIALTTLRHFEEVQAMGEHASPADLMDRSMLLGIGPSPIINTMIEAYGWPTQ